MFGSKIAHFKPQETGGAYFHSLDMPGNVAVNCVAHGNCVKSRYLLSKIRKFTKTYSMFNKRTVLIHRSFKGRL